LEGFEMGWFQKVSLVLAVGVALAVGCGEKPVQFSPPVKAGESIFVCGEPFALVEWNGSLWIAAQSGLYRYASDGTIQKAHLRGLREGAVSAAVVLPAQRMLCLAVDHEIIRVDSEKKIGQAAASFPGKINQLEAVGRYIFAATDSGIYQATDPMLTQWKRCPGPDRSVTRLENFYAVTADEGVWCFSETGLVWQKLSIRYPNRISAEETEVLAEAAFEAAMSDPDQFFETAAFYSGGAAVDSETGVLYLGTVRGVLRWDLQNERADWLAASGLGTPLILDLLFDARSGTGLLALTADGIYRYEPSAGSWKSFWKTEGGVAPKRLFADALQRGFWVGTAEGLIRVAVDLPEPELSKPGSSGICKNEPSIQALQKRVIDYAEVAPEKIARWRQQARWRAFVPSLNLTLDRDWDGNVTSSSSQGISRFFVGPDEESSGVGFSLNWDLGDFVWSTDQTSIDVRSRLMVQLRQDLLEEATRLYFERRKLIVEFEAHPSHDPLLNRERQIRIQELTAYLDAISGGWFSREMEVDPMEFG
jgi:hypothetical protein